MDKRTDLDDEESQEIENARLSDERRLPSGYHPSRRRDSDITTGNEGQPVGVHRPPNPEDNYSDE